MGEWAQPLIWSHFDTLYGWRAHLGCLLHALPEGLQLSIVLFLQPVHLLVMAGNLLLQSTLQGSQFTLPLSQEVFLLLFGEEQILKVPFGLQELLEGKYNRRGEEQTS